MTEVPPANLLLQFPRLVLPFYRLLNWTYRARKSDSEVGKRIVGVILLSFGTIFRSTFYSKLGIPLFIQVISLCGLNTRVFAC